MLKAAHIPSEYPKLRKQVKGNVNKILLYLKGTICNVSYSSMPGCKVVNATNVIFFSLIEGIMGLRQHKNCVKYYKEGSKNWKFSCSSFFYTRCNS